MNNLLQVFDNFIGWLTTVIRRAVYFSTAHIRTLGSLQNLTLRKKCIRKKTLLFLGKRLAMLLEAGLPVSTALITLQSQMSDRSQHDFLQHLISEVELGRTLSSALTQQSAPPILITLVALGERTGTLATQLRIAVDELLRQRRVRERMLAALVYPAIITVVTGGLTVFLLVAIFPKITPIFESFATELPWSTRFLMGTSQWLLQYGWLLLLLIFVFVMVIWFLGTRVLWFIHRLQRLQQQLPVIGYVIKMVAIVQICRMTSVLFSCGMRSSDAMQVVADHTSNKLYSMALCRIVSKLETGQKLSRSFREEGLLFTDDMVGLLHAAEESGSLPKTLMLIADLYEYDVEEFLKRFTVLLEPLLMVVMGLIIGFIALSIVTPLYGLTSIISA